MLKLHTFFSDWFLFLLSVVFCIFFFFDEEPFLDPTDWNITHVLLLLISIIIVINENVVRSRFGQFVFKDQTLLFATFSFWFSLENWARLIVVFFCFHCLSPLEFELIELVDVFTNLQVFYTSRILSFFLITFFSYILLIFVSFFYNWFTPKVINFCIFVSFFILAVSFLIMLWDFLLTSLSSINFSENRSLLYYNNTRGTLSYDILNGGGDYFDWHIENNDVFIFRFESAYFFFLQLFNIVAMYSLLFVYTFIILDILNATASQENNFSALPSFTALGVLIRWFDHVWFSFFVSHFAIILVGLRIFFKIALDFNF